MSSQLAMGSMLYSKLSGTALGMLLAGGTAAPSIYHEQAPDNAALPYVVFLYPASTEDNTTSRRLKDNVVRVYAVALNDAQAGSIDKQIDTMLHHGTLGSAGGWTNIRMQRENDYQLITTTESGVRYYTSGADYRAEITTT
jgi:hypothetical protein